MDRAGGLAVSGAGASARAPAGRVLTALPGLRPALLWPAPARPLAFPLACPDARAFYFARNAVWRAAHALGLAGAEVLVPAYHHGVEVEALVAAGVVPRFVRVDAGMALDLEALEAAVGPRTRAIYVIHYLGFPQPMAPILALARRRGLAVVEDCALSLLSADGAVPLGARGDLSVFCLYKTLPVPHGGLLVSNGGLRPEGARRPAPLASTLSHAAGGLLAHLAHRAGPRGEAARERARRAGRRLRRAARVEVLSTGTSHFDPAAAEVGMSPLAWAILRHVDCAAVVEARRRNWLLLHARLRELAPPVHRALPPGVCPLFYPLVCEDKAAVAARLAARGVETVDFWSVGHPACPSGAFPEVEALRRRVLELPLHQDLDPSDMAYLASAAEEALT